MEKVKTRILRQKHLAVAAMADQLSPVGNINSKLPKLQRVHFSDKNNCSGRDDSAGSKNVDSGEQEYQLKAAKRAAHHHFPVPSLRQLEECLAGLQVCLR